MYRYIKSRVTLYTIAYIAYIVLFMSCLTGAMAGAYYGIEAVPVRWREICEGTDDAMQQATDLHELVTKESDTSDTKRDVKADDKS